MLSESYGGGSRILERAVIRRAAFILSLAALPLSIAYGYHRIRHPTVAERIRELEALKGPTGAVLLIGDSITRQQDIYTLCGLPVINAGISGTGVYEWATLAPRLVARLKPRIVIYALGMNDSSRKVSFDARKWKQTYDRLRRGGFALGVLPVHNGGFASDRIAQMNAALSQEPGYIPPFPTNGLVRNDGVHLNEDGERRWRQQLQSVCAMAGR